MKVIWESEDIEGGLVLHKPKDRELFILAYNMSERTYMLVSLADGMILGNSGSTRDGMAAFLNNNDWRLFNRIRTCTTVSQFLSRSES